MQEERPSKAPSEDVSINPDEGFGPHISEDFLELYGKGSVFVTATVDCLTWRFIQVLVRAEKLPQDTSPLQYGEPEMREALEDLLAAMSDRGIEKLSLALMRSAVGRESPQAFQEAANSRLGSSTVSQWLTLLEHENYAGASGLLSSLHER